MPPRTPCSRWPTPRSGASTRPRSVWKRCHPARPPGRRAGRRRLGHPLRPAPAGPAPHHQSSGMLAAVVSSADLPERPHLDQLRRQDKEFKRAALAGDPAALARLDGYLPPGAPVTLAVAQLAVAREYGFASWARLTHRGANPRGRGRRAGERVPAPQRCRQPGGGAAAGRRSHDGDLRHPHRRCTRRRRHGTPADRRRS